MLGLTGLLLQKHPAFSIKYSDIFTLLFLLPCLGEVVGIYHPLYIRNGEMEERTATLQGVCMLYL